MIMEQLDHMDANCSVLGPLFHHHMPENFGKGHVINEIRHLLDTARDTFMDNSTHVNYNVHRVSCGFSHHRVSHKGPKIVTSFDLFRKEFFESCRTQAKVPQRPLKERYFKVGDEYTSTWTSKKGRVYTLTHKVMKVWSRNYIDTCFQNLLEDQQAFRNELTLRREEDCQHLYRIMKVQSESQNKSAKSYLNQKMLAAQLFGTRWTSLWKTLFLIVWRLIFSQR